MRALQNEANRKKVGVFYIMMLTIAAPLLLTVVTALAAILPEMYIEIPTTIEVSYALNEVPLLGDIAGNNRLTQTLAFAADKSFGIAEKVAEGIVALIWNRVIIITLFIFTLAVIGFFLISGYLEHRKRIFSITYHLNRVLESRKRSLKANAGRIQKRRITTLFKDIAAIESAKCQKQQWTASQQTGGMFASLTMLFLSMLKNIPPSAKRWRTLSTGHTDQRYIFDISGYITNR